MCLPALSPLSVTAVSDRCQPPATRLGILLWFSGQIRGSRLNQPFVYKGTRPEVSVLARFPRVSCYLSQNHLLWGGVGRAGALSLEAQASGAVLVTGDQDQLFDPLTGQVPEGTANERTEVQPADALALLG